MLHQGSEERRQVLEVVARRPSDLPSQKRHGVLVEVKQPAQLVEIGHGLGGRIFDRHLLAQGEDRQTRRAASGDTNQFDDIMQQPLIVTGAFGGHQDAGQSVVGRRHDAPSLELAVGKILKPSRSAPRRCLARVRRQRCRP